MSRGVKRTETRELRPRSHALRGTAYRYRAALPKPVRHAQARSAFPRGAWEREKRLQSNVLSRRFSHSAGPRVPLRFPRATRVAFTLLKISTLPEQRSPGAAKRNPGTTLRSSGVDCLSAVSSRLAGFYEHCSSLPRGGTVGRPFCSYLVPTLCVGMPTDITPHCPSRSGLPKSGLHSHAERGNERTTQHSPGNLPLPSRERAGESWVEGASRFAQSRHNSSVLVNRQLDPSCAGSQSPTGCHRDL